MKIVEEIPEWIFESFSAIDFCNKYSGTYFAINIFQIFFKCSKIIVNLFLTFPIPVLNQVLDSGKTSFGFLGFMTSIFPVKKRIFL